MLLRRYGKKIQSVEPNFDANALTEVGYARTGDYAASTEEFEAAYERMAGHEVTGTTEGGVKSEVEAELLGQLLARVEELRSQLGADEALVVENQQGTDQARLQDKTTGVVVSGENRFRFEYTCDPPIKLGVYRRRSA
ncbi:MAG TPA: hypothetical protein VMK65_00930 [Longimicrobiales bacterium]|nr:hypothetical protein [Longimicrobiales bacterium]